MIGNGQSINCTHKGKLDVICKHKDGSMSKETWDVKSFPQLITEFHPSQKGERSKAPC